MPTRWMLPLALLSALLAPLAAQVSTGSAARAADRRLARDLSARFHRTVVDLDLEGATLDEALTRIARLARVNLLRDPSLGDRLEEESSLSLERVRLAAAWEILRERFDLALLVRGRVLRVMTREAAWKRSMGLSMHSVADMLYEPPDFPAPEIGIRPSGVEGRRPVGGEVIEKEGKDPDRLVDILRRTTGGDAVWDFEGARLEIHRGRLIVHHVPEVRRRVARLLARLRGVF